ncbi:C40 family peptidase [Deinococcus sp. Marseille-Q6407]|uniref:C40 family peptidase n=1 Tax=Deinococcus sp. Marseille-Q6407 TaxID=2969223 RepID=UPI0021C0B642|nr:C40 family peptidase [Deinococcus sp. Marseille-Q6407]
MKALRTLMLSTAAALACTVSAGALTAQAENGSLAAAAEAHGVSAQLTQSTDLSPEADTLPGYGLEVESQNAPAQFAGPVITPAGSGGATVRTAASRYLGIPYRMGGTGRGTVDCSGYTQLVFRNMGISIPRTTGGQWRTGYSVSSRSLRAGDLVFFNTMGRGVSHVGVYLGNDQMANANSYYGRSMVEPMFGNRYWASRYVGARRVL